MEDWAGAPDPTAAAALSKGSTALSLRLPFHFV